MPRSGGARRGAARSPRKCARSLHALLVGFRPRLRRGLREGLGCLLPGDPCARGALRPAYRISDLHVARSTGAARSPRKCARSLHALLVGFRPRLRRGLREGLGCLLPGDPCARGALRPAYRISDLHVARSTGALGPVALPSLLGSPLPRRSGFGGP